MASGAPTPYVSYAVFLPDLPTASPYAITVKEGPRVQHLLDAILGAPYLTRALMNERVYLYQCGTLPVEPPNCDNPEVERYREAIRWLRVEDNKKKKMIPTRLLQFYFPSGPAAVQEDKIDVIVATASILETIDRSPDTDLVVVANEPYPDEVTFNIKREPGVTSLSWHSVLTLNDCVVDHANSENSLLPDFIKTVMDTPRRAANDLEKGTAETLFQCIKDTCIRTLGLSVDAVLPKLISEIADARPYAHNHPEVYHYLIAFHYVIEQQASLVPPDRLTSFEVNSFVFSHFQLYWHGQFSNARCTYGKKFPFPLIAREQVDGEEPTLYKYEPQPDAAFLRGNFPYFLAEVDSLSNEFDKYRLYIQMACALKVALHFRRKALKDNKFFLMGAFFFREREIYRYFVYADDDMKTRFKERKFRMDDASQLMTFLYEFYTYANFIKDDDTHEKVTYQYIARFVDYAKKNAKESLLSKARSKKRTRSQAGHDDTNQSQGSSIQPAITRALQKSRFQVRYYDNPEEYGPLVELPAHVVEATSLDGELVIAKLPRKNSAELSLLQELSLQKSLHNHTIPLLDTVPSNLGRLIIVPRGTPLSSYPFPWDKVEGGSVKLRRELVEGIAFLHRQKIAHLDIKPDNLVYSFKFKRLYIIDFDLAMRCKDVDEMVELSCGTPGWSAPEIVHDDEKPLSVFSPIRADLWSCGKVLWSIRQSIDEEDSDITRLAFLLMDSEPSRRPLLHEVVDEEPDFWTSGRLRQALNIRACDGKSQQMSVEGGTKLKRAHGDTDQAGRESSVSKVPRKDGDSTVRPSSASSSSSSSSSSHSSSNFSPDTSFEFDSLPPPKTWDFTIDSLPPPPIYSKTNVNVDVS